MVDYVKYEPQEHPKLSSYLSPHGVAIKLEAGPERVATTYTTGYAPQHWHTQHHSASDIHHQQGVASSYSDEYSEDMSDGKNEARAMRVLEIMNDFRTLQHHISSLVTRPGASPPSQGSYYLDGYVVLRQCSAESQAILASHYNPGNIGLQSGQLSDSEVEKATLQRIILDSSTRRFQAHKIYLRAAAGMRWVQLRQQVARAAKSNGQRDSALARVDEQLRQELNGITDQHVVRDLSAADRRKGYWVEEDPALDRMLQWIRMQR